MCISRTVVLNLFSTGPHYGPSASLTGRTHVSFSFGSFHISFYLLTNLSILMLNFTELMAADDYLNLILPNCMLESVG